jgi:phospholipid/cholesterol/gamma-HCH transport system permease protein
MFSRREGRSLALHQTGRRRAADNSPMNLPEIGAQGAAELRASGDWVLPAAPHLEARLQALAAPGRRALDASGITALDTCGAWLLHRALGGAEVRGLRPEFRALLDLVAARAPAAPPAAPAPGVLARIGANAWRALLDMVGLLAFVGAAALAAARWLAAPRRIRGRAILHNLQSAGVEALPITGLLAFLLGIVIAYQGAEQLRRVGANLYIADLVGLAMVRELAPLITAIIVAGRSGSAYTAQIGTMKVTEEIDALRTVGVPPLDLLVLPKLIALMLALPLLTVYSDAMGILGGMLMANAQLGVSFGTFIERLGDALTLRSFLVGVGKTPVFAAIIAAVGCFQGFRVNASAESVGRQTTLSVVQAIFLVILADAAFSVAFSRLQL